MASGPWKWPAPLKGRIRLRAVLYGCRSKARRCNSTSCGLKKLTALHNFGLPAREGLEGLVDEGVSVPVVEAMAANGNTVMHIAESGVSKAADRSGSARVAETLLNQSLIFLAAPADAV